MNAGTSLAQRVEAKQEARAQGSGVTIYESVQTPEFSGQLARALPKAITPERFVRLVMTQVRTNQMLMRCDQASFLGAVMTAAQLGLEFDARQLAYLIPRKVQGQWRATAMIGYRGYIELARRSGQVRDVQAHVVYERDEFVVEYGDTPRVIHKPTLVGERGAPIAAYAVAFYKDGGTTAIALRKDEIEKRRGRSAAGDKGPWATDWDAMARKTAVRALAAYLPQTPELANAIALDEVVRTDHTAEHLDDATVEIPDDEDEFPEADTVAPGEIDSPDGPGTEVPPDPGAGDGEPATDLPPSVDAGAVATAPSGLSEYEDLAPAALRVICGERDLDTKGSKAELIARLVAHDERPFTGDEGK